MRSSDTFMREQAEAFVPPAPEGYSGRIAKTVAGLKARGDARLGSPRGLWRPLAAAAAAAALLLVSSAAVFGAKPALAAELPGVNGLVYSASPSRAANEADKERAEALLSEAFRALAFRDHGAAARCFREGALQSRENYLAAAYADHLLSMADSFPGSTETGAFETTVLNADQKAFRYTVHAALELVLRDGGSADAEGFTAVIWENGEGMHIESIKMQSEGFREYAAGYEAAFGAVPDCGGSFDFIPTANACLSCGRICAAMEGAGSRADYLTRLLAELNESSASPGEKAAGSRMVNAELERVSADITPAVISAEETAAMLMYRYWLGGKTGEAADFSDILERNEQTDLFCWDALLEAETVSLGVLRPLTTVEAGSAEVLEVLEDEDGLFKARFYVQTHISDGVSQGVGEEVLLTLRRCSAGYEVIGFDREVGDGRYIYDLKPLARAYKAAGCSWQEAGRKAYEEQHARLVREAGAEADP